MEIMTFITQPQVMVSLAVLIFLLWRISYGYKYGLIAELLEIAAIAVGFCILNIASDTVDKFLGGEKLHIVAIAFKIIAILLVYRAIQGISNGARGVRKVPILGTTDKLLGACFGLVEIYIWLRVLNYITGYDFEGAIRYTFNGIIGLIHI